MQFDKYNYVKELGDRDIVDDSQAKFIDQIKLLLTAEVRLNHNSVQCISCQASKLTELLIYREKWKNRPALI
jgi:hypothetical protein